MRSCGCWPSGTLTEAIAGRLPWGSGPSRIKGSDSGRGRRGRTLAAAIPWWGRASWLRSAACAAEDPDLFHPDKDDPQRGAKVERAKAVCARCPVIAECRDLADRLEGRKGKGEIYGVWGGESVTERLRRRRTAGPGG